MKVENIVLLLAHVLPTLAVTCASQTGRGHVRVYNYETDAELGCLDSSGQWTIDGDCAVYYITNEGSSVSPDVCKIHTSGTTGGWCQFGPTAGNETLICNNSLTFNQGSYYRCDVSTTTNNIVPSSYHYTWSWTSEVLPTTGHPTPIYWLFESGGGLGPHINLDLHFYFTSATS